MLDLYLVEDDRSQVEGRQHGVHGLNWNVLDANTVLQSASWEVLYWCQPCCLTSTSCVTVPQLGLSTLESDTMLMLFSLEGVKPGDVEKKSVFQFYGSELSFVFVQMQNQVSNSYQ